MITRDHIFPRAAEFGRCRGISMFPRNFTEFEEIPRNDQILGRFCLCQSSVTHHSSVISDHSVIPCHQNYRFHEEK